MRKVIWCCAAAGMMTTGSVLALAYYACRCPDSLVGRSMYVIAQVAFAMQPMSGLTSMAVRTSHDHTLALPIEESVFDDPQPVAAERKADEEVRARKEEEFLTARHEVEPDAAPIVINEDDPMPREQPELKDIEIQVKANNTGSLDFGMHDMPGREVPPKGCPIVMPYCHDDDEETPKMPRAEGEESEPSVFKAWVDLFAEGKDKIPDVEELPPPKEEGPQGEPKCQEDRHLHEHYPGCPRTTSPYPSKDEMEQYFKRIWNLGSQLKKKGGEESSEEPPHSEKKETCPRTKGVDTMEYRKSDAAPGEFGPGPVH